MNNDNYQPFGKEWKKMLMKHNKNSIIEMYKKVSLENQQLK
jgi:hypothetical protein